MDEIEEEFRLLGMALVAAQRVEYALYGLAAHAAHMPSAQKERRFRELTPELFLRGDASELKATLGQLVEAFGDAFLIKTDDLVDFYKDRNVIAHDYVREFRMRKSEVSPRGDGGDFLIGFLKRALHWEGILRGLLNVMMTAVATKQGRESELDFGPNDLERTRTYYEHAGKYLASKSVSGQTATN